MKTKCILAAAVIHDNKRFEKIYGKRYFTKNGITENRFQAGPGGGMVYRL